MTTDTDQLLATVRAGLWGDEHEAHIATAALDSLTNELGRMRRDVAAMGRALASADRELERVKAERDEWEERYDELLATVGGTWPG